MTNLNYSQLVQDTLDPEGEYILYTRLRLARSISGFRFPPCIRRGERRQVERLFQDAVSDWPGRYVPIMSMSNSQHDHLIQQQLLFKDPDDFLLSAGFGRDWPDARGIYCDNWQGDAPSIIIWCNAEDHLWIISHGKGGNVQGVFTELSKAVSRLETALKARGRHFVEDAKYGFLNASPANIGTALRASVYVKLVRLSRQPGFSDLVSRLRLEARSDYSHSDRRFTGISEIANAEALGKSEVDLINIMIRGVGFLIELEKRLERGEEVDLDAVELPTGC
jgi:creatine kinase